MKTLRSIPYFFLLLISLVSQAQTKPTQLLGTKNSIIHLPGSAMVDSFVRIPPDTLASAPAGSIATPDLNYLYFKSLSGWGKVQGVGGSSLDTFVTGTRYTIDSTAKRTFFITVSGGAQRTNTGGDTLFTNIVGLLNPTDTGAVTPLMKSYWDGKVTHYSNVSALKSASPYDGEFASTNGYYSDGDGGGGLYVFSASSALADNGFTVIQKNSGTGRWLLINTGIASVKQAGAYGDGVHDDSARITVAAATLQHLYFPAGTYITSGALHIRNSGFAWYGVPGRSIIKRKDFSLLPSVNTTNGDGMVVSIGDVGLGADDGLLYGMTIDGNVQNQTTGLTNTTGGYVLWIRSSKRVTIEKCEIRNGYGDGIYTYSCSGLRILYNYIHDCGYGGVSSKNGISLQGNGPVLIYGANENNLIQGNWIVGIHDSGVAFGAVSDVSILGNQIDSCTFAGIEGVSDYLSTLTNQPRNVTIKDNFLRYNGVGIGVSTTSRQHMIIEGNQVIRSGSSALSITQSLGGSALVDHNYFEDYNLSQTKSFINGFDIQCENLQFTNNHVSMRDSIGPTMGGFFVLQWTRRSLIANNVFDSIPSAIAVANVTPPTIRFNTDYVNIFNNTFVKPKFEPIQIALPNNGIYTNAVRIVGNTAMNIGASGSRAFVYVKKTGDSTGAQNLGTLDVRNNAVYDDRGGSSHFAYGVLIGGNSSAIGADTIQMVLIKGNDFSKATISGVQLDGKAIYIDRTGNDSLPGFATTGPQTVRPTPSNSEIGRYQFWNKDISQPQFYIGGSVGWVTGVTQHDVIGDGIKHSFSGVRIENAFTTGAANDSFAVVDLSLRKWTQNGGGSLNRYFLTLNDQTKVWDTSVGYWSALGHIKTKVYDANNSFKLGIARLTAIGSSYGWRFSDSVDANSKAAWVRYDTANGTGLTIGTQNADNFHFYGAHFLIGTTTDDIFHLDVNGKGRFTGLNVSGLIDSASSMPYIVTQASNGKFYHNKPAEILSAAGVNSSQTLVVNDVASLRSSTVGSYINAITLGYNSKGDGGKIEWYWDASSALTDDGVYAINPTGNAGNGRWIRVFKGRLNAATAGVKSDGTDQTSLLNTLFSNATVKEVVFDNGPVTIQGKVNAQGKKIILQNDGQFTGVSGNADTLTNALIECDYKKKAFDTSLNVTGLANSWVSVQWFGAKPDAVYNGSWTDNLIPFQRAIQSQATPGVVYIPKGETTTLGYYYRFSSKLTISRSITLLGDGSPYTIMVFPGGTMPGLKINSNIATYKGFTLKGQFGSQNTGYYNDTANGIWVNGNSNRFEDIAVYNFDGNGWYVYGDVNSGSNANQNTFKDCAGIFNGGSGIYVKGGDANQNLFLQFAAQENARWGVWDGSFLGNRWDNSLTASNVRDNSTQQTQVVYKGTVYNCIQDNTNIRPDTSIGGQYWVTLGFSSTYAAVWDSTKTYLSGGSYYVSDPNAQSVFTGVYTEGDQIPFRNNGRSIVFGGIGANSGSFGGSLSNVQGVLTATNLQALDASSGGYVRLGSQAAYGNAGLNFSKGTESHSTDLTVLSKGAIGVSWGALGSSQNIKFVTPEYSNFTTFTGRDRPLQNHTGGLFGGGIWLGHADYSDQYHLVSFGTAAPTSGDFGVGDIVINTSGASSTLYWQCTAASVAGNGGTWVAKTSGGIPSLTNTYVGVGNASNQLSGTSDLTFDGQTLSLNNATSSTMRYKVGGAAKFQWEASTSALRLYSYPQSAYIYTVFPDGKVEITPSSATYASGAVAFQLDYGRAQFPFLAVGNSTLAASSINFQNSTNLQGYLEYNSTGYDWYASNTIRLHMAMDGTTKLSHYAGTGNALTNFDASGNLVRGTIDPANIFTTSSTIPIANGGTGATTASAALNNLLPSQIGNSGKVLQSDGSNTSWVTPSSGGMTNPMTAAGDLIYGGASGTPTSLAGNTTATKQFLTQTGDGTNSAAPSWGALSASDIPNISESQVTNLTTDLAGKAPVRVSTTVTTSSYTISGNIKVVFVNYTAGTATITLPASPTTDDEITIRNLSGSTNVTISGPAAGEVNTCTTNGALTYHYDGANWYLINKF